MRPENPIRLEPGWYSHLSDEFQKTYMIRLMEFLRREPSGSRTIHPLECEYYNAFNATPFDKVKVVILGQDPYHGVNQANGLGFSVPQGMSIPPSLRNIFREISSDLGLGPVDLSHGNLTSWADQGVLLLNSVLTVVQGNAASHRGKGWEIFTDRVVSSLNSEREGLVFMLWGAYAQKKGSVIDDEKHLVLKAPHPSPLSAHRGFLGCRHFSQANAYLALRGSVPIDWRLE